MKPELVEATPFDPDSVVDRVRTSPGVSDSNLVQQQVAQWCRLFAASKCTDWGSHAFSAACSEHLLVDGALPDGVEEWAALVTDGQPVEDIARGYSAGLAAGNWLTYTFVRVPAR